MMAREEVQLPEITASIEVCYFTLPDVAVKVIAWFYFEALHISNA
jgi:hypothetical protein